MKVYVVAARYCEDTVICGVALDESTAAKIVESEEKNDDADCVWYEGYDTDDYLPLIVGAVPYEVLFYPADERWGVEEKIEASPCSMCGFVRNAVGKTMRNGISGVVCCYVFAMNKEHAIEKATALLEKEQKNTK